MIIEDLKREDTRLRDWNRIARYFWKGNRCLEKRRYSITRLKHDFVSPYGFPLRFLKREDTRLRDWNCTRSWSTIGSIITLKREDTRLRDWNLEQLCCFLFTSKTWKEKILDYEIETNPFGPSMSGQPPPLKREDTRLRDWNRWKTGDLGKKPDSWKEKILDYEIETRTTTRLPGVKSPFWLEKRRYSITRLKQACGFQEVQLDRFGLKREDTRLRDWNRPTRKMINLTGKTWKEKILDYEIETSISAVAFTILPAWKEKILDYEIETFKVIFWCDSATQVDLKREDTRLRDWN